MNRKALAKLRRQMNWWGPFLAVEQAIALFPSAPYGDYRRRQREAMRRIILRERAQAASAEARRSPGSL